MLGRDEVDDIDLIALRPEQHHAGIVGDQVRLFLQKQAVRDELAALGLAFLQVDQNLVLAAGRADDQLGFGSDAIKQGIIGRSVTGVQGDDRIIIALDEILGLDIVERQIFEARGLCRLIAEVDHFRARIDAVNLGIEAGPGELVIHRKCQITLARSDIQDLDPLLLYRLGPLDPLDENLDKSADLPIFGIFIGLDIAGIVCNAQSLEKQAVAFDQVIFVAVVGLCFGHGAGHKYIWRN